MGSTNNTSNYSLSQFIGTDKPAWLTDYNGDMLKIDTGINAAKVAADGAALTAGSAQSDATTANNAITNTITPAITSLQTTVGNQGGTINTITALIGNGTPTTTDQTIIGAINEINADVGDLNTALNAQHRRKRKSISANDLRACITNDGVDLSIKDITIGDYITINSDYKAVVADIDTFYGEYDSYAVVNSHHIAMLIVGTAGSVTQQWNSSNTTSSGYNGSALHTELENLISTIEGTLGTLISHQKLLTTSTLDSAWQASQKISALTESQIYGAPIYSINGFQQGEAWKQLEIFRKFSFNEIFGNQNVWLRSVQSDSTACSASRNGSANNYNASQAYGVVGLVLFH